MRLISVLYAKTHLSSLLLKVEQGEKFIITRRGKEIAMLVPVKQQNGENNTIESAISTIRRLRKGACLGKKITPKSLREKGRR